jgi:anti-anti-sigma factor
MTFFIQMYGDIGRLILKGDFDVFSRDEFLEEVEELLARGARQLVIDMRQVRFVSSNGVSALLGAHVRMRKQGGSVALAHPTREIRETLQLLGLSDRLPVIDGAEAFGVAMG